MIEKEQWRDALAQFWAEQRVSNPLPERDALTDAEEFQCRILGGALWSWLERHGPRLLAERSVLANMMGVDPEPIIVIVSSTPGLVAAQEILDPKPDGIFFMNPDAYKRFLAQHPDPDFAAHILYASAFEDAPTVIENSASRWIARPGEAFWYHREESVLGQRFARGGCHLWRWDGQALELVEEAIEQWVS